MKTHFTIVQTDNRDAMGRMIERHIEMGWELAGPMFVYNNHIICQPMIQHEVEKSDRAATWNAAGMQAWAETMGQADLILRSKSGNDLIHCSVVSQTLYEFWGHRMEHVERP